MEIFCACEQITGKCVCNQITRYGLHAHSLPWDYGKSSVFTSNLFLKILHGGEISLCTVLFETIPHNFSSTLRPFFRHLATKKFS